MSNSQRSRLTQGHLDDHPDHDEDLRVDVGVENSLEHEPTWSIMNENHKPSEDNELIINNATEPSVNASIVPQEEFLSTSTTELPVENATSTTAPAIEVIRHRPPLTYDDSDWKPIIVSNIRVEDPTRPAIAPGIVPLGTHTDDLVNEDKLNLPSDEEDIATDLPVEESHGHAIEGSHHSFNDDKGVEETSVETSSTPANKFSFLQWFNSQLNNANRRPIVSSTTPSVPATRFYTLKPTAISYTGVQPILRPKPSTDGNSTADEQMPSNLGGFVISTLNRSIAEGGVRVPPSFQVQTVLNLRKDPQPSTGHGLLVESPRSSKSLQEQSDSSLPQSGIRTRELHPSQVELLKDFFPPVRRPVPRPVTQHKLHEQSRQQDSTASLLPIEDLFGRNNHTKANSPIYTFKLNQGQTVHDVLSQLLADLTMGGSPADVDIDGSSPILTVPEPEDDSNIKKASNKKVDDDRLRPWSQMPFRPSIFNSLSQAQHNYSAITTSSTPSASDAEQVTEISHQLPITNLSANFEAGNGTSMFSLLF